MEEKEVEYTSSQIMDVCNDISLKHFHDNSMTFAFSVIASLLLEGLLRVKEEHRMALFEEVHTNVLHRLIQYTEEQNAKS